jgi:hypothetical protein
MLNIYNSFISNGEGEQKWQRKQYELI